ncbi:MAG: Fic family protein [Candidatus Acidiferrales bacterium]
MSNWDADSPQLRQNLALVLEEMVRAAEQREDPTVESARHWQALIMQGLDVPDPRYVGAFRGEQGLEGIEVKVGVNPGVRSITVAGELRRFEEKLQTLVAELDELLLIGQEPDADQLAAIVDLCAWVHAEWVRIHPFANGNGRTARLWANCIAMRYGLPPFIRLRPAPNAGYAEAGAKAMQGDWKPTAEVFRRLLAVFLSED